MKLLRLNIIALMLLAVAAALLWMALPQILESVARFQLQRLGLNNVKLQIHSISTEKIVVDTIRLGAPDNSWCIDAEKAEASFILSELINGEVDGISIKKLGITHTPLGKNSNQGFSLQPLLILLNQSWQERVPFSTLEISQLSLHSEMTTPPLDVTASTQIHKQTDALAADINFYIANDEARLLKLDWQKQEGLRFEFMPISSANVAPAFVRIKPVGNDQLVGELKVDMDGLRHWASPLTPAVSQFAGDGILEVGLTIKEQADNRSTLTAFGVGQDFQLLDFSFDDAQISVNGSIQEADQGFEFVFDGENYLQVNALSQGNTRTQNLRIQPIGTIRINDGKLTAMLESDTQILITDFRLGEFSVKDAVITWPGEIHIDRESVRAEVTTGGKIVVNDLKARNFHTVTGNADVRASVQKKSTGLDIQLHSSLANLDQIVLRGIKANEADAQFSGILQVKDDQFSFQFAENSSINAQTLSGSNWSANNFDTSMSGNIDNSQGFLHWYDASAKMRLDGIKVLEYSATNSNFDWSGTFSIKPDETIVELSPRSAIEVNQIDSQVLRIDKVNWPLAGFVSRTGGVSALNLESSSMITANKIKVPDLDINQATFTPRQKDILQFQYADNEWSLKSKNWRANVTPFNWQQYPITPQSMSVNFEMDGNNKSWSARSRVKTDRITTQVDNREIVVLDVASEINTNGKNATVNTEISIVPDIGRINVDLTYQIPTKRGEITFNPVNLNLADRELAISDFGQPWPYKFDLVAGLVDINGRVQWDSSGNKTSTQVETNISIEQGGGFYQEVLFSGLTVKVPLNIYPVITTQHSAEVNVDQIDFGLPVTNARLLVSIRESGNGTFPELVVDELSARFLGGEIKSDNVRLDFNRTQNSLMMNVENLDIEEIMQLQEFEGLAASGKISGQIPIDVRTDGIYIEQGEVHALSPGGRINYAPEGGTESIEDAAPGTEIVFQALKDFRYDVMTADTFYNPNGDLLLQLHLEGTSPELESTRPVHVNINLEQNVLSLLRSLRLVEGLNEKLDERVREHYETMRQ